MSNYPPVGTEHTAHGYGTQQEDFASNPTMSSPLAQSAGHHQGIFTEDFDASQRGSSVVDGDLRRSSSRASGVGGGVSRNNTLKKKSSMKRTGSLKPSSSKKSLGAGSLKGFGHGAADDDENFNNVFYTPVPTTGTPTEVLANRFQAWRQLLKSLITYFREVQNSYEMRAKALHKVQNTLSNIQHPPVFMSTDGLGEASRLLDSYHKRSIAEASKAREIENDVIGALTGLRSDLSQKIKEIKSLSGDFKNSVDKEKENTRREIEKLRDALQHAAHEDGGAMGKSDPYVVRLGVDRALERQIDEENYLHRAYLNLESSGRELESIIVGEIQKAYNALAGILKREADDAYNVVESLRSGPITLPKDQEWYSFVTHDPHFVDPGLALRRIEDITYPGRHDPAATEIRAGMLERKSKYLKSYTPGWYVLSPTHLHEFKSADKIYTQPPVMSLYLLDQKLGSHSDRGSSSHKFMLKGKQSGGSHRGHNWVFRAESFDTMMAWFEDIRILTEKTGAERQAFVRKHARSVSGASDKGTVSSDGLEDDEADQNPYSADAKNLAAQSPIVDEKPKRPAPGGRFPSDMVLRKSGTMSTTNDGADDSSEENLARFAGVGFAAGAGGLASSSLEDRYGGKDPYRMDDVRTQAGTINDEPGVIEQHRAAPPEEQTITATAPVQTQTYALPTQPAQPVNQQQPAQSSVLAHEPATASVGPSLARQPIERYDNWTAPVAIGTAGVGAGILGAEAYRHHQKDDELPKAEETTVAQDQLNPPLARDNAADAAVLTGTSLPTSTPTQTRDIPVGPEIPVGGSAASIAYHDGLATGETPSTSTLTSESALMPPDNNPTGTVSPHLGGNEREGAHMTGSFFPRVVRHDTNISVSKLHVPGEFRET